MPRLSQWFIKSAVIYLIIGMIGGIIMGAKQDFAAAPAHAHLNLIGWVTLVLMGLYYNAFPAKAERGVAKAQFWVQTVGLWLFVPSLFLKLTGTDIGEAPIIIGSFVTLLGVVIFAYIVYRD